MRNLQWMYLKIWVMRGLSVPVSGGFSDDCIGRNAGFQKGSRIYVKMKEDLLYLFDMETGERVREQI